MFFKNQQTALLKDQYNGDIFPEALFADHQHLIPFWKTFFHSFYTLGIIYGEKLEEPTTQMVGLVF